MRKEICTSLAVISERQRLKLAEKNRPSILFSIMDIYQAREGRRWYIPSWPAPATMKYLDALAGIESDAEVWEDFQYAMGIYPKGSLVRLNDNSLGFAVSVPEIGADLESPFVAVEHNSVGVDLTHHYLVDLDKEKDVSVVKELDAPDVFGDKVFNIVTNQHSSRLKFYISSRTIPSGLIKYLLRY